MAQRVTTEVAQTAVGIRQRDNTGEAMKNKKTNNPKKNGTLRPWLVDVVVDNIR